MKIESLNTPIYGREMPRVSKDKPTFDFILNPTKTLAESTLKTYKKHLNHLYDLSLEENKKNSTKPILRTKDDLLTHSDYAVKLIKQLSDKRLVLCQIYSSVFYVLGHQDFSKDTRGRIFTTEFRKTYYNQEYKEKLIAEGKLPPELEN
jgi:hypothetical protein